MRKIILVFILTAATLTGFGQFRFRGRVLNFNKPDTITLNMPFVYGHNPEGTIRIGADRHGRFSCSLPVAERKFATLSYKGKQYLMLLTPGKDLKILLNRADTSIIRFTGTAARENNLLYRLNLVQPPFFRKPGNTNHFTQLSAEAIQEKVVAPWFAVRDQHLAMIDRMPGLSATDKLLISQEVRSNAGEQLNRTAPS